MTPTQWKSVSVTNLLTELGARDAYPSKKDNYYLIFYALFCAFYVSSWMLTMIEVSTVSVLPFGCLDKKDIFNIDSNGFGLIANHLSIQKDFSPDRLKLVKSNNHQ